MFFGADAARDQGSRAKCRQAGLFWHADGTLGADLYNHPLISSDADMRSVISLCNRRTADQKHSAHAQMYYWWCQLIFVSAV